MPAVHRVAQASRNREHCGAAEERSGPGRVPGKAVAGQDEPLNQHGRVPEGGWCHGAAGELATVLSRRGSALFPGASFGEGLDRDPVHLESPGGACIGLQVDEQVDDLVLADAAVKGDPELPAEGLTRAECRCDGH
jgi:hypothetical protein